MVFTFSLHHLDLNNINSKEDLLQLLTQHDYNMYIYSLRTAYITVAMCKEMNMSDEAVYLHFLCSLYHDIGKLGMSSSFLNYPSSYTDAMFMEMRKHPLGGADLLEYVSAPSAIIENCRHHHTNFDGTGYPGGISGEQIPLQARITRIADSIDAYMSKRSYKESRDAKAVVDDLYLCEGTHYDPRLLLVFKKVHMRVIDRAHQYGNNKPSQDEYMEILQDLYFIPDFQI